MLNKYEAIGIFASVTLMAIALFLLRVDSTTIANLPTELGNNGQTAIAVVANGEVNDQQKLFNTLATSIDDTGKLQKLIIDDVLIGTGEVVKEGDSVTVNYIGTLQNGQQFDNSYSKGEPFVFTVGDGKVIKGWDTGLTGMQVGGKRILVIPPELGYGKKNVGPIPANSTLIFAIELLKINQ